jgi:hypothetical protein
MSVASTSQRYYSKAQKIAGNVIWSDRDILQLPFYSDGQVSGGTQFAAFQVPGRDLYLHGYSVALKIPNSNRSTSFTVNLLNGIGQSMTTTQPDPTVICVSGVNNFAQRSFAPFIPLPSGSYWQANITVPVTSVNQVGSGITLTYMFSYSNGPLVNSQSVFALPGEGIGFWTLAQNFVVSS